jgi:membrane protease subunit HflK
VLAAIWLYSAVYVVDEQEQAVVLRFGKYYETVGPGLNIYFPPIDKKYMENVTRERAYTKQGQMLTEDENIVEVPLTVQYKISNLQDFVLNVDQPEISLQHATDSALRHVVGSTAMDQVLTEGRELMASEIKERLQRFLDTYRTGITVTQVNVQSAAAPREVQEAFDDVIRAREDEQRSRNQAETYANGVVPEARGQAQRIIEDANGYRDETSRAPRVRLTASPSWSPSTARHLKSPVSVCTWTPCRKSSATPARSRDRQEWAEQPALPAAGQDGRKRAAMHR